MVFATRAALAVYKTTGGRLWNKPWGLKRYSPTQKENRRKQAQLMSANSSVLKEAAEREAQARRAAAAAVTGNQ